MKRIVLAVWLVGSVVTLGAQHRAAGTWMIRTDPKTRRPGKTVSYWDKQSRTMRPWRP